MNIGFVGTGLMGTGMARSLIRKGHHVRIYNRTRAKAEAVAQLGGEVADSPADAARDAEVIVTMLADPAALLAWWRARVVSSAPSSRGPC